MMKYDALTLCLYNLRIDDIARLVKLTIPIILK